MMMSVSCHGGGGQGSTTFNEKLDLRARLRFSQSTRKLCQVYGAAAGCGEIVGEVKFQFKHDSSFRFFEARNDFECFRKNNNSNKNAG